MENNSVVLVIGSINLDIIQNIPSFPKIGESLPADRATLCAGGKGANQAVQCAKMELPTKFMACIDDDVIGDFLIKNLDYEHLDLSLIKRVKETSGLGVVSTLPDKSLFAMVSKGANYSILKKDIDKIDNLIRDARMLVLQLEIPREIVEYCISRAKLHKTPVCLNAAPNLPLSYESISSSNYFIANEVEASYYIGKSVSSIDEAIEHIGPFARTHKNICIFTLGALGSVISDGNNTLHIPAKTTKVVETTGAGDSFVGGFVKGLAEGFSIWDAAEFASECSAVTIRNIGGISSLPTFEMMRVKFNEIQRRKSHGCLMNPNV